MLLKIFSSSVSLIYTPHRGTATARNSGIAQAQGQILIFIDSDIVVELIFVQNHYNFHASNSK